MSEGNSQNHFVEGYNLEALQKILYQILPLCQICGYKQFICIQNFCKKPKEPICYNCNNSAQSEHFLHRKNEVSLLFLNQNIYTTYSNFIKNKKETILRYLQDKVSIYQVVLEKVGAYLNELILLIQAINKIELQTKHNQAMNDIHDMLAQKINSKYKVWKPQQKDNILASLKNISFEEINKFNDSAFLHFRNVFNNDQPLEISLNKKHLDNFKEIKTFVINQYEKDLNNVIQNCITQNHLEKYIEKSMKSMIYNYQQRSVIASRGITCQRLKLAEVRNTLSLNNFLQEITFNDNINLSYLPLNLKVISIYIGNNSTIFQKIPKCIKKIKAFNNYNLRDLSYNFAEFNDLVLLSLMDGQLDSRTKKRIYGDLLKKKTIRICKIFTNSNDKKNNYKKFPTNHETEKSLLQIHQIYRRKLNTQTYMKIKYEILQALGTSHLLQ